MINKNTKKFCIVTLTIFLIMLGFFYFILNTLKYMFYGIFFDFFTIVVILLFTFNGIKNNDNQQPRPEGRGMLFSKGGCTQGFNTFLTAMNLPREPVSGLLVLNPIGTNKTKITSMCSAFLPLISIFSIATKGISTNINGIDNCVYILFAYITLICSMLLFFFQVQWKKIKVGLGIIYIILLIPIFFILLVILTIGSFGNFGKNTILKTEVSPNSIFLAEIVDNDQGALGGNTLVKITRLQDEINIIVGKLKKHPRTIYTGKWGESKSMTLRWKTDDILYINEYEYILLKDDY